MNPLSMFSVPKTNYSKVNLKSILKICDDNRKKWILTIQLFGPNYSISLNSIRKLENDQIQITNYNYSVPTIRIFKYSNSSNNSDTL